MTSPAETALYELVVDQLDSGLVHRTNAGTLCVSCGNAWPCPFERAYRLVAERIEAGELRLIAERPVADVEREVLGFTPGYRMQRRRP